MHLEHNEVTHKQLKLAISYFYILQFRQSISFAVFTTGVNQVQPTGHF